MVGFLAVGTLASMDAEAKRMGGGRSFGRQSESVTQRQAMPSQSPQSPQQAGQFAGAQRAPQATPAPQPARNRWLGPIAGLAAGLGIAALLSHFGLGEAFAGAMANFIIIALIAAVAIWAIRKFMARKRDGGTPAFAGASPSLNAGGTGYDVPPPRYPAPPAGGYHAAQGNTLSQPAVDNSAPSVPAGFDSEAFLRNAKVHFVRLQTAWDAGNLDDIREFTTPEMFAEIKLDLDSRGAQPNQTDVVQLNGEVVDVQDRGNEYFASVRFSGLIRESKGAAAEPFNEVWNLSKANRPGEGWLLAGIQQIATH